MGRGLEYEVPQKLHREFVGYDFNRLAVYLSFRTPIGGKLPPFPPGGATAYIDKDCV